MTTPRRPLAALWAIGALTLAAAAWAAEGQAGDIDFQRARELMQKQRAGQTLTKEEQEFLTRAQAAYRQRQGQGATRPAGGDKPAISGKATTGLVPLCDMGAGDKYKGEDGGLYGGGRNEPPAAHAEAARKELAAVQPRDADGKPAAEGKIVLMSIGMSNTTQEFSNFVRLAAQDASRAKNLVIVDAAMGGQDVAAWAESRSPGRGPGGGEGGATIWELADKRLQAAGVTPKQVQVVWLKQAMIGPARYGEFPASARKLADGEVAILNLAEQRYPNLRVAYLSSRIYAGYAVTPLNPEPYSYESAFACRWLIQQQIAGEAKLNCDPAKGPVKSPLLLWGPYLWGDGTTPRKSDGLVWLREDLGNDGTHPSPSGGQPKVARMLLKFFQTDPLARTWYLSPEAKKDAKP